MAEIDEITKLSEPEKALLEQWKEYAIISLLRVHHLGLIGTGK
jgi:hypothetical protein